MGPANPLRVELDKTVELECSVDAKPMVKAVKWIFKGRFIATKFKHIIPSVGHVDAGVYTCSADNELGQVTTSQMTLDVLYGPSVTLAKKREVNLNDKIIVECEVESNPKPSNVKWTKVGDPNFSYNGHTLRLNQVTAEDSGRYICTAINTLHPSGKEPVQRVGNASIDIFVKHRPGKSFITQAEPFAIDGKRAILTCGANPPGYPEPRYSWWREGPHKKIIALGRQFQINPVELSSAGEYFCQSENDLGKGSVGSTVLEVHQAPRVINHLKKNIVQREGQTDFHISCSAIGKPKPMIRWLKDGQEILENESDMFQVSSREMVISQSGSYRVESTLKFVGPERILNRQLMPQDKGLYMCIFDNKIGSSDSAMVLTIKHVPVIVHQYNKVAYDVGEKAVINCQMQANPEPTFEWNFDGTILQRSRFYNMSKTNLGDDIYQASLSLDRVREGSYGEYICKGMNEIGQRKTIIKLQPKGRPDQPTNIRPEFSSYNAITVGWNNGFDGGYKNTTFTIEYRKIDSSQTMYKQCGMDNPCNVSDLDQHSQYVMRVRARNVKGESKFSAEANMMTKVDVSMIPKPDTVYFEKLNSLATFHVDLQVPLDLIAKIELENDDGTWRHYDGMSLHSADSGEMTVEDPVSNLRIRLCLEANELLCGPYAEALIVNVKHDARVTASGAPWFIAVVVGIVVLALVALGIVVKCYCCSGTKSLKNEDVNSNRPTIIHGTQPPPYTSAFGSGIENKAVDSVKDISDDNIKTNLFAGQNGYSYTGEAASNSNSNSANGGSVNSQDSLWNVKSNGASEAYNGQQAYQHNGYMPYEAMQQQQHMMQQQFTGGDDYSHYPYPDEYLNDKNRQYLGSGDPFVNATNPQSSRLETECK